MRFEAPALSVDVDSAVVLTVIFFAIFDRWTSIHDPINSIVSRCFIF